MSDLIANDLNLFKASINSYTNAYNTLVKDFEEVQRLMKSLNGMWDGQAHDTLMSRFEQDRMKTQDMVNFMKEILANLNYAEAEYRKCENEVRNMIDSMKV